MVLAVGFALQSRNKISIRHGVFSLLELKGLKREERLALGAKIMVAHFKVFRMNDASNVGGHRRAVETKFEHLDSVRPKTVTRSTFHGVSVA